MTMTPIMTPFQECMEAVIRFHGHHCPGLTFGIRVGERVREEFGQAEDEELVAVVESDMCAVDAIQFLTGCTFGKGNLVFLDHGKNAFTFFRRSDGKNRRFVMRGGLLDDLKGAERSLADDDLDGRNRIRREMIEKIMQSDFDAIFRSGPAQMPLPEKARIHQSFRCDGCGELVMATRIVPAGDRNLCIPCRDRAAS